MAEHWALLIGDKIAAVIICNDGDDDFAPAYVEEHQDFTEAVKVEGLDPLPGMGWTREADGTFTRPVPVPVPVPVPEPVPVVVEAQQLYDKSDRTPEETDQLLGILAPLAGLDIGST